MNTILYLQSFSSPILDKFMVIITNLGSPSLYFIIIAFFYWLYDKELTAKISFTLLINAILNGAIKDFFMAPRPIGMYGIRSLEIATATGYSFPSGHAELTATFWTSIMLYLKTKTIYIVGIIMILSVGLSRLYLGVHWPIDVACGIIFGTISSLIIYYILNNTNQNIIDFFFICVVMISLLGLIFFKSKDFLIAVTAFIGFYFGTILDKNFINFKRPTGYFNISLRLILGISILVLLYLSFHFLLPSSFLINGICYLLIAIWISAGAPFCFNKFKI